MTECENTNVSFSPANRSIRVLIADDEDTLLRATVELLKNEGMVCEHVSDGKTAMEMVRRAQDEGREFDVLVADYKMPGLDGIQVLDAVHSECPDTRVIILTGYPSVSSAVRSLKGRAIDYITKPFDVQYLVSRVREAAEYRRLKLVTREFTERNRVIVETAEEGVWFVDRVGRTEFVNAKMAELLGYSVEEMHGLPMHSFMDREHHPDATGELIPERLSERGQHEICFLRKDASTLWTIVNTSPAMSGTGDRIGAIAMVTDITDRRRTEKRLQEARRLESLSVLAGGVAHDFNNLLQGMLGYAELARRGLPENSPERGMIEEIETAGRRAAHLSGQMLAYSGRGTFLASRLDLAALVATQTDILTSIASPHARLKCSFSDDLPPVMADAEQLTQVFQSLVTNAAESFEKGAGPTGHTDALITIRLSVVDAEHKDLVGTYLDDDLPPGRYVRLDVTDNGCGMDAETVSRVFDPFFTTKFQGRGLGMAAALGMVRGHKGVIHLDSKVGRGTTVTVLLPVTGPEQLASAGTWTADSPSASRSALKGRRILIVDDEKAIVNVAGLMLERVGCRSFATFDGRTAIELFRKHADEIDCVLLDLTLPGMSGTAVCDELHRIRDDVRVVLSSGYDEEEAMGQFRDRPVAGFIQKPYRTEELLSELSRALKA